MVIRRLTNGGWVIVAMALSGAIGLGVAAAGLTQLGHLNWLRHQTPKTTANTPSAQLRSPLKDSGNHKNSVTVKQAGSSNTIQNGGGRLGNAAYIGIFVSEAPGDPEALRTIDWVHAAGLNVVYNYSSIDGTPEEITGYLNYAHKLGIKVIFSLHNLYDQLPNGAQMATEYPQFGNSNSAIAQNVAQRFGGHPATWGFSITDESPETPASLGAWQGALSNRYQVIKSASNKPVMEVLLGYSAGTASARRAFLGALRPTTDQFALDYYPIPYGPIGRIGEFASDMRAVGDSNGWGIIQAFSWSSYPGTAKGLGYNLGAARTPTQDEMVTMGRSALNGGAKNLLFYSYFDIKNNPSQLAALRAAVAELKAS